MTPTRFVPALILCFAPFFTGCSMIVGANGDINDGSVERTSAEDNDARMKRMRESGSLRPGEYEALQGRMNGQNDTSPAAKPTVDDLERRIEESRKAREASSN